MDEDPRLEGKGLATAFADAYPDLPDVVSSLAATEVAWVAIHLEVPVLEVMDVIQSKQLANEKSDLLTAYIREKLFQLEDRGPPSPSSLFATPGTADPLSTVSVDTARYDPSGLVLEEERAAPGAPPEAASAEANPSSRGPPETMPVGTTRPASDRYLAGASTGPATSGCRRALLKQRPPPS